MKNLRHLIFLLFLSSGSLLAQSVSINTDNSNADASAMLDVKSTTKGLLAPRMTTAQRTAIAAPAAGLLVYDTDTKSFWHYNGTDWTKQLSATSGWALGGNNAAPTDFLGTTNNQNLVFKANNTQAGKIDLANFNTFWGFNAGAANTTGNNNTATGHQALLSNTTGISNVATGVNALAFNTIGISNVATGANAMYSNTSGSNNVAAGYQTLFSNTIGSFNTAYGVQALYSNVGGNNNTATGHNALYANTSGSENVATGKNALTSNTTGSGNTATGVNALFSNTTGGNNTAYGQATLYSNTTGTYNTASGYETLLSNTTGYANTADGYSALHSNTTGYSNSAIGLYALFSNTTGFQNTTTGRDALYSNTIGSNNTANGFEGLYKNTTGSSNTANGIQALYNNTTGGNNTASGYQALIGNTTGGNNTALGTFADVSATNLTNATAIGYNAKVGASNSLVLGGTGADAVNVGVGTSIPAASAILDLQASNRGMLVPRLTTAQRLAIASPANGLLVYDLNVNTFWYYKGSVWTNLSAPTFLQDTDGDTKVQVEESPNENIIRFDLGGTENMVLRKNAGGFTRLELPGDNTFVGQSAGNSNAGANNAAFGLNALFANTTGGENAAHGSLALFSNTTGNYNTANGYQALFSNSTGSFNTANGRTALISNTTGSNNTALGYAADVSSGALTNATALGSGAVVNASNKVRIGNTSVTVIEGQVAFTTSDGRFKSDVSAAVPGLNLIGKLKPVTYHFNYPAYSRFLGEKNANQDVLRQKEQATEMGFIAQDVEKTLQELGLQVGNLLHVPSNDQDNYSIAYGQLVVPLVKAVQEQQAQISGQEEQIKAQQAEIAQLRQQLNQQHASLETRLLALEKMQTASANASPKN